MSLIDLTGSDTEMEDEWRQPPVLKREPLSPQKVDQIKNRLLALAADRHAKRQAELKAELENLPDDEIPDLEQYLNPMEAKKVSVAGGSLRSPPQSQAKKPKSKFRLRARTVFLTYSQVALGAADAVAEIKESTGLPIKKYMGVNEKHDDGGDHLHLLITFGVKPNLRGAKCLDITFVDWNTGETVTSHPNIQRRPQSKASTWVRNKIAYVHKTGGDVSANYNPWDTVTWKGYRSEKGDFEAWWADRKILKAPFPFTMIKTGNTITAPKQYDKKSSWLIVGPADTRKTTWLNKQFEGKSVYQRPPDNGYPYELYAHEPIIICDDVVPELKEILHMTEWHGMDKLVYGKTRYHSRSIKARTRRIFIICCNPERVPEYVEDGAFQARFNRLDVQAGWWKAEQEDLAAAEGLSPYSLAEKAGVEVPLLDLNNEDAYV